ncbi:phosphoribosylglycinamide formyltransferase [Candidatus Parcubacteria bacterium]|nr:MAG: phosphoribosylglycinamide formyltransferase [Candidatus Parcubacteria bacterium]
MSKKLRIGILVSGGGTNMQAIVRNCLSGKVDAEVAFVASDNPGSKGLAWAKKEKIPNFLIDHKNIRKKVKSGDWLPANKKMVNEVHEKSTCVHSLFKGDVEKQKSHLAWKILAEGALLVEVKMYKIDYLILAGFMQLCTAHLIDEMNEGKVYPGIINIHPALLPAFPGVDGYGDTIRYGCKFGGCTVHFVDYGEDTGPIIAQRAIPVNPGDTKESFMKKGLEEEYEVFSEVIHALAQGRVTEVTDPSQKRKKYWLDRRVN